MPSETCDRCHRPQSPKMLTARLRALSADCFAHFDYIDGDSWREAADACAAARDRWLVAEVERLTRELAEAKAAEPFLVGRGHDAALVRVSYDSLYSAWAVTFLRVHDRAGKRLFPFQTREDAMATAKCGYGADFIL